MQFHEELRAYGLSDKEAAVYLAVLELGPSSVQTVARRAKIVRPTVYSVMETLASRGLVTHFKKDARTLFQAESPKNLKQTLEGEEKSLNKRKDLLEKVMPGLLAMARVSEDKPTVRYFEGIEGLKVMRQEMLMYTNVKDIWYQFTPVDYLVALFGEKEAPYFRSRSAKGVTSKTIFTTKSAQLREELSMQSRRYFSEMRFVSPEKFTSSSGMTIYKDRIAIGSFTGNIGGVIIESPSMAQMMRECFLLLWDSVERE